MNVTPAKIITNTIRRFSTKPTTNGNIRPIITNRNPRNLEKLRLERKPNGYSLEDKFTNFWNKLELIPMSRYVEAHLIHHSNTVIVQASTKEWAIRKYLHSAKDKQAYIILARVFAERCMASGYVSMACNIERSEEDTNSQTFLRTLESEGLVLEELPEFNVYNVWRTDREKKPWTVLED